MIKKVKEKIERSRHVKKIFYGEREIQDIMIEFYVKKRKLII